MSGSAVPRPADRPSAIFIDRREATPASTAAWTRALSDAGVLAATGPHHAPVAVGRGDGAAVAFRLLLTGHAAAAILIDPEAPLTEREHGPLLLVVASPGLDLAALQIGGVCDQLLEPGLARPVGDAQLRDLAEYMRGWLEFHDLLGRAGGALISRLRGRPPDGGGASVP